MNHYFIWFNLYGSSKPLDIRPNRQLISIIGLVGSSCRFNNK